MKIESNYSHTFFGLFWFDVPLGLFVAFLYHLYIRDALIQNLPYFITSRLLVFKNFDWLSYCKQNLLVVVASVFIGAISHLFWDSFTHENGYFVSKIPILKASILWNGFQIPYLKIAQHGSSFMGFLVLFLSYLGLEKHKLNEKIKINLNYWLLFFAIILVVILIRFEFSVNNIAIGNAIVSLISALLIALVSVPILLKIQYKKIIYSIFK